MSHQDTENIASDLDRRSFLITSIVSGILMILLGYSEAKAQQITEQVIASIPHFETGTEIQLDSNTPIATIKLIPNKEQLLTVDTSQFGPNADVRLGFVLLNYREYSASAFLGEDDHPDASFGVEVSRMGERVNFGTINPANRPPIHFIEINGERTQTFSLEPSRTLGGEQNDSYVMAFLYEYPRSSD